LLDSPLYHGFCLCPHCQYPGTEADFRTDDGSPHPNRPAIQRLFVEHRAGRRGLIAELLPSSLDMLPEPERTIRLSLAGIRAEILVGPDRLRRRELGKRYLHLYWLYLDEAHLEWDPAAARNGPEYLDEGPRYPRLMEALSALERLRPQWPEIPLSEADALSEALRFHLEAYELRAGEPEAEEAAHEERLLAHLFWLSGKLNLARDMFDRARATCLAGRSEAARQQQAGWDQGTLTLAERRRLTSLVRRLSNLAQEITEERRDHFGRGRQEEGSAAGPGAPAGSPGRETPRKDRRKRRFKLFG